MRKSLAKKLNIITMAIGVSGTLCPIILLIIKLYKQDIDITDIITNTSVFFFGVFTIMINCISKSNRYEIVDELQIKKFEEKCRNFYSGEINILEDIIMKIYPKISMSLYEVALVNKKMKIPVIPLISSSDTKDFKSVVKIDSSISTIPDNTLIDQNFIEELKSIARRVIDNPTFRLLSIKANNEIQIGIGSYEKTLSSCDKHYYGMIKRFPLKPNLINIFFYKRSKIFRKWKDEIKKIINNKDFPGISAGIGCSVLTVFNVKSHLENINYVYLLMTNSNKKNALSDRHVIPSFMFQPSTVDNVKMQEKELDIKLQVLREFGEEILGLRELRGNFTSNTLISILKENEVISNLWNLLETKKAFLITTGLFLDIYRLRPEITCVLIIDEPDFYHNYQTKFRYNWETKDGAAGIQQIDIESNDNYEQFLMNENIPLCPPGKAALVVGRSFAINYIKNRQSAP